MKNKILKLLENDAKVSPEKIATLIGEDAEKVKAAIKEMEDSGIIRKYKTVIDWEKAGIDRVFAFIDVRVTPSRGTGFDDMAKRIYNFPEVHSLYLVSGDYDLRVVIEGKSMREVGLFVAEKLATLDGVLSTRSSFLLKKYKDDGDFFEGMPEDERLAITP